MRSSLSVQLKDVCYIFIAINTEVDPDLNRDTVSSQQQCCAGVAITY